VVKAQICNCWRAGEDGCCVIAFSQHTRALCDVRKFMVGAGATIPNDTWLQISAAGLGAVNEGISQTRNWPGG